MEVKASLKHLRMSPQKVRLVLNIIRTMPVEKALDQLRFQKKLAGQSVAKLINSAVANAVSTYSLEPSNLYVKTITADEGVMLKRFMPRAHGRATSIRKRGCHIAVVLGEIKDSGQKEKKTVKAAEPVKLEKLVKEGEKTAAKAAVKSDKSKKADWANKPKMFRRKAG